MVAAGTGEFGDCRRSVGQLPGPLPEQQRQERCQDRRSAPWLLDHDTKADGRDYGGRQQNTTRNSEHCLLQLLATLRRVFGAGKLFYAIRYFPLALRSVPLYTLDYRQGLAPPMKWEPDHAPYSPEPPVDHFLPH